VLALGKAKVDGLQGGLNHISRQLLPKKIAEKVAKTSRVDLRPRGEQVRDSIDMHLGAHFDVALSKDHKDKLDLSVKQWSVGRTTIADLEAELRNLLQLTTPNVIPLAIGAAVEKTEEFELVQKDRHKHVSLTGPAQQRLDALRLDTLAGAKALSAPPSAETPASHRTLHPLMAELHHHTSST
jgi:hypothetical protein